MKNSFKTSSVKFFEVSKGMTSIKIDKSTKLPLMIESTVYPENWGNDSVKNVNAINANLKRKLNSKKYGSGIEFNSYVTA